MERLEPGVLLGEPALAGHVHKEDHLALQGAGIDRAAVESHQGKFIERHFILRGVGTRKCAETTGETGQYKLGEKNAYDDSPENHDRVPWASMASFKRERAWT